MSDENETHSTDSDTIFSAICERCGDNMNPDEGENGWCINCVDRVKGAARDLLEASKTLRAIIHDQVACVDSKYDNGIAKVNAAIAKAEGTSAHKGE